MVEDKMSEPENINVNSPIAWEKTYLESIAYLKLKEEDLRIQGNELLSQSDLVRKIRMDLESRYHKNGLTK
jgi:hypothetical protein